MSMSTISEAREALVTQILDGDGRASRAQRRAAFDNVGLLAPLGTLIDKVVRQANQVTDQDIASARASGLTEDEIFELVICGAVGEAVRQHTTALAALEAATGRE
jgi:alkylhydroperoxidase family enzyme